jgi:hypothetical protein
MRTRWLATAMLGLLALGACTPPEVKEQQACARLGITPDDDRFWTCMQHMEAIRESHIRASREMLGAGTTLLQPQPSISVYAH